MVLPVIFTRKLSLLNSFIFLAFGINFKQRMVLSRSFISYFTGF